MNIIKGFKFAFTGIKEAFKTEKNMKVHFLLAILATSSALFLNFSALEWVILAITIGFVFAMEFINTSLEQIVDIVSPQIQEKAQVAKDVAAAGVLVSAVVAILVGSFLFLPKIF
ncbi:diacylglycerol kinase [Candidatus Woesebacteria bacterium CG07_land_8_20_14_0_80_44_9]|uniref:Diacylglycerol kinase n=2 Tax=Candidatus Woeseibacteriota TaxID=1752722 RepID=A0A2H0BHY0_9BACT|nr:MAG: diacylglycerol kinase [Candidatus Woesebacteria bacterium CG22_combo_CG10-13_8_21_14_all_45_10]PIU28576.1 MAG: diacylglycerol kinase [Candidatus Woesebacteria bacterium CG07_land_8_20_14_0_80_44_9]